jgi:predicted  nucleic acid-binding Zn-ribbon protein
MHPDVRALLILQEREQRLDSVQEEIDKLPRARAEANAKVATHERDLTGLRDQLRRIEVERKKLELDVQTRRNLISKYERQKFDARKAEEIAALEHAIAQETLDITVAEDAELECMQRAETMEAAAKQAELALIEERQLVERLAGEWSEREKKFLALKVEAEASLAQAEKGVSDEALERYDRIARAKSPVLVPVKMGTCGGCHMNLPPQTVVTARGGLVLTTCPSCGRLLYGLD